MKRPIGIILLVLAAVVFMLCGCSATREVKGLRSGDLLFVSATGGDFSNAINEATGGGDNFVHVGVFAVVGPDSVVIEADDSRGVVATPMREFLSRYDGRVSGRRIMADVSADSAVMRACAMIGMPYDWEFEEGNDKVYCSELVQMAYVKKDGTPLFSSVPMNFLGQNGDMPEFWVELFGRLGKPVPQGQPGTNPNGLSKAPFLIKVDF